MDKSVTGSLLFNDLNESIQKKIERAHLPDLPELLGNPDKNFELQWENIPQLLSVQCERFSSKKAIIFYDGKDRSKEPEKLSYKELFSKVRRTISLMDKFKIPPNGTIATVDLYNHIDTVIILLAAWSRGNLVVPVNMEEDIERIQFILTSSNVEAVFVRDRHITQFEEINNKTKISKLIQLGGSESSYPVYHDVLNELPESSVNSETSIGTPALLVYTSGTTGNPKGVILSHRMLYDVDGVISFHEFTQNDIFLTAMRLFHVNAIITSMLATLYCGGTLVLMQRWMPGRFWEIAESEKITNTSVVPAMIADLNSINENFENMYPLIRSHFKTLICGAGTLKKIVAEEFMSKFKIRITHGWGMSETTCWGCWLPKDLDDDEYHHLMHDFEAPSIGTPMRHCKIGIIDGEGNPLPEHIKGEIVIAGKNIMERYAGDPEANSETFKYGVLRTGDEGFYIFDRRNRPMFFITGRLKDIIERGGEKFSPYLMDEDLSKIKGVINALVYGFSHKRFGQEIGVIFEMEEGELISEEDVWKYCKKIGYSWSKTPKEIKIVKKIPKTSTGKDTRKQFGNLFKECFEKHYKKPDWF